MSVIGIDFGAKNSVIAAAGRGGVDVILNGNSNRLNPCMVGFDRARSMGEAAAITSSSNFRNTIFWMKRLVGLSFEDPRAQTEMKLLPFKCVPIQHSAHHPPSIGVSVTYNSEPKVLSIESVAGMMVKHLGTIVAKQAAEKESPRNAGVTSPFFPQDWVIAVPGYYTDAQKRAFLTGCEIAGINGVLRLMHETTATALAYGIFKDIRKEFVKEKPTHVLFLDIGATAYSVAIVAFEPGKLTVKSTHHDPDLGGRDFDLAIANWFAGKFEAKYGKKLSGKPMEKPKAMIKLLSSAEKAKKTLSPAGVKEVRMSVECLMDDLDFAVTLKAEEYEKMCAPLIERLEPPIQRAFQETGLKPSDMSSVEIVGGGTRVGCVKRALAKILNMDASLTNNGLSTTMNADEAVARGATLQSAILSPRFKVLPYEIIEFQPYPIKIAWDGESSKPNGEEGVEVEGEAEGITNMPTNSVIMFERGSNFPCVRRVALRRMGDFTVSASYDETALDFKFPAGAPREIATFTIKAPKDVENKIRVNVKQDLHGTITLSSAQMVEEIQEEEMEVEKDKQGKEGEGKEGEGETKKETEGEAKKEEGQPKKKKIKKTNLEFYISRPMEWSKPEKDAAFEAEVQMDNADRIVRETADMRNELESYIYDMRDRIVSDSQLSPYCTDAERVAFSGALESTENWLYENGFDAVKSVYADKLTELKKLGNPIEHRHSESKIRPNAVAVLQKSIEKYKSWLNSSAGDEKFSHVTDEERAMCHAKCDEVSCWMYDILDKQGSLPASADPVVSVDQIHAKSRELTEVVSPIMHKPAPKPKPVEKKENKASADESKTKDEPEPMDEDVPTEKSSETEPMDTQ